MGKRAGAGDRALGLVAPFALTGPIESGMVMWNNVAAGILIAALAAFGGYSIRESDAFTANSPPEIGAWLAGIVGLWIAASPFVLSGTIDAGTPMSSNVGAGIVRSC